MTYGFEREYFVKLGDQFVSASKYGLPYDGCGYLAEARGQSAGDVVSAAYLLKAEEHHIYKLATAKGLRLLTDTPQKLGKTLLFEMMRTHGKSPQADRALYGKWNKQGVQHAGLHVHFGNENKVFDKEGRPVRTVRELFDYAAIVFGLDRQYAKEIKAAGRALGLYKLNAHGFEYRSLPASIDPVTVAEFIAENEKKWR